jgi:hypothetical protein
VSDGVAPRRDPGVGAEEVAVPRVEAAVGADAPAVRDPLDGGVAPRRNGSLEAER